LVAPSHIVPTERSAYFLTLTKPLALVAALLAASGLYALVQRRRGVTRSVVFLSVGWCLAGLLLVQGAAAVAPVYSGVELYRALPKVPAGVPIYSVATYDQTLPFYWQRTLPLVAYRGELNFGLEREPGAEEPDMNRFVDRWRGEPDAYAVMDRKTFALLGERGVPMREIARDMNRVLVSRR
jgi:hypothetical protein